MAQLSESLVRDTIKIIDKERLIQLTINEVRQLCWAWLLYKEFECPGDGCHGCRKCRAPSNSPPESAHSAGPKP